MAAGAVGARRRREKPRVERKGWQRRALEGEWRCRVVLKLTTARASSAHMDPCIARRQNCTRRRR
eukprot:5200172-Pleurochrysis_carterae.AAC.1